MRRGDRHSCFIITSSGTVTLLLRLCRNLRCFNSFSPRFSLKDYIEICIIRYFNCSLSNSL